MTCKTFFSKYCRLKESTVSDPEKAASNVVVMVYNKCIHGSSKTDLFNI